MMKKYNNLITTLLFGLLTINLNSQPYLPPLPEPGTAVVDGNVGEWDLSTSGPDFFAHMYEGFNNNGKDRIYSNLYLRYDCQTHIMYALVYQADYDANLIPLIVNGDHWIASPDINAKLVEDTDNTDGIQPDFAFIGINYDGDPNHARGWEGSFSLVEVGSTTLLAHSSVIATTTSGTSSPSIQLNVNCGLLPVELTLFSVSVVNNIPQLDWETATEVNNYGFEIQRKSNLKEWNKIGFIEGHGNSNSPKYYTFEDNSIDASGKYIYRLKQVDIDGTSEYSSEVETIISIPKKFELNQNYPNPFNPSTLIKFSTPEDGFVTLIIFDVLGNEIAVLEDGYKSAGKYSRTFDASDLSSGMYFYTIRSGNFVQTKKMLLMK